MFDDTSFKNLRVKSYKHGKIDEMSFKQLHAEMEKGDDSRYQGKYLTKVYERHPEAKKDNRHKEIIREAKEANRIGSDAYELKFLSLIVSAIAIVISIIALVISIFRT
jgi:hypothetical protein